MNIVKHINRFYFNNHTVIHHQIGIIQTNHFFTVNNLELFLQNNRPFSQL